MAAGNAKLRGAGLSIGIAIAIAATGCGSGDDAPSDAAGLEPAVAERLAERSDAVADSLDSGDICGAAEDADDLAREVERAEMPEQLRAEAEGAAAELVNAVNCDPEPVEEEKPPKPKDEGKDEEDEEDEKGDGGGGDDDSSGPGSPGRGGDLPPGLEKHGGGGGLE